MLEYIVDCELRPLFLDGRQLVAPYTTAHHVHERLIRCKDCRYGTSNDYCMYWRNFGFGGNHFCSYGKPRAGDP